MVSEAASNRRSPWQERMRERTANEIRQSAAKLLNEQGIDAVSIRAVARELGMSSPAIYRYFSNHEDLVNAVIIDVFEDLNKYLSDEADAVSNVEDKIVTASWAFREWAVAHQREFELILHHPLPPRIPEEVVNARWKFGATFMQLFARLWYERGYATPAPEDMTEQQHTVVERFRSNTGGAFDLPPEALLVFIRNWSKLYGVVSMEAMGQNTMMGDAANLVFDMELAEMGDALGVPRRPPHK
ncbi:TetR/AcrR family transcriptional regulator [Actinopolyspora sp. H202]|uniref:TetR/AcrR family transcriptional regulator n=1 Tax=Actinopolyspora sp. H202 TaxID=1500456 RepID=UPI003EE7DEA4